MSSNDIDSLITVLADTKVEEGEQEVNFSGKGLKLDSEKDAEEVVQAIKNCKNMTALNMEGNTMGVEASKAIAKALESQSCFKRALWKDMFTGRLKTEIPVALNYLSGGIILAKARLVELDLSDNAFGPVGIKGILMLLKSPSCYSLQELRLNNNGLGISGGKMLAEALLDCLRSSTAEGPVFSLKVFICGRNRLENEGSLELAKVFEVLGSLEVVSMPQNGINHEGITALSHSFSLNKNIREINLNDNTATEKGAKALAKCIADLQHLEVLNFGDCLVRTEGAIAIAESLQKNKVLRELYLGFNEIKKEGGIALCKALSNKSNLQKVDLDGNQFGNEGCQKIKKIMTENQKKDALSSLSEDEGTDKDDEDEEEEEEEDDNENENEDETSNAKDSSIHQSTPKTEKQNEKNRTVHLINGTETETVSASIFLESPTSKKLLGLGEKHALLLLKELGDDITDDQYIELFMKVSSVVKAGDMETKRIACECVDEILSRAFKNAVNNDALLLTNTLLVHLGLIKSEDKTFKAPTDLEGPLVVLEHVVRQKYFSKKTRDVLQLFLSRPVKAVDACGKIKHSLMQALYQF